MIIDSSLAFSWLAVRASTHCRVEYFSDTLYRQHDELDSRTRMGRVLELVRLARPVASQRVLICSDFRDPRDRDMISSVVAKATSVPAIFLMETVAMSVETGASRLEKSLRPSMRLGRDRLANVAIELGSEEAHAESGIQLYVTDLSKQVLLHVVNSMNLKEADVRVRTGPPDIPLKDWFAVSLDSDGSVVLPHGAR